MYLPNQQFILFHIGGEYRRNVKCLAILFLNKVGGLLRLIRVSRKLRPRKHRPQTSDLENSDPPNLENSDLENSDPPKLENSDPFKKHINIKRIVKYIFISAVKCYTLYLYNAYRLFLQDYNTPSASSRGTNRFFDLRLRKLRPPKLGNKNRSKGASSNLLLLTKV